MSSESLFDVKASRAGGNFQEYRSQRSLIGLYLIVLVASPLIDVANELTAHLRGASQHQSTLYYAWIWATSWSSGLHTGDSWDPMRTALAWYQQHSDGRLYERLFFVDHVKFQYPLTSLLPFWALSTTGIIPTDTTLNQANFWIVAANVLAAGALAFTLARRSPDYASQRWQFAIVGAVGTLTFYPLLKAFQLGQVQVWINALFMLSILSWLFGRKGLAGVLIGLICLLKPQFALFMLWGLLRREWRFVAGWSVVLTLGVVASLAVFGMQNNLDYFAVLRELSRTGEVFVANQSINGLLNRLYAVTDPTVWQSHGFPPFNPVVYVGTLVTSGLLIGAALLVPLRGQASGLLDFLGAALTFTIASPIAWEHHFGILPAIYLSVMFAMLGHRPFHGRSLGLLTLAISFLITAHWMGSSWTLWGALAVLGLIYWTILAPRNFAAAGIGRGPAVDYAS